METLLQDLRYGARMLTQKPVFTLIAVVTLALGIGANTAIFSVVNAVLLRACLITTPINWSFSQSQYFAGDRDGLSMPEAQEFQERMQSLEDLTAFQSQSVNVTGGDRPDRVRGAFVSANFFKVFNLNPIVGRTFVEGEDRMGGPKLAVVNEKMWRERLNSDRNLEAKRLILNGEPYSVIGVVTESFEQPLDRDVEVWMPMANYPGKYRPTRRTVSLCDGTSEVGRRSCRRHRRGDHDCQPVGPGLSERKRRSQRQGRELPRADGASVCGPCSGFCSRRSV